MLSAFWLTNYETLSTPDERDLERSNNRVRETISFEYASDWIAGRKAITPFDLGHQLALGPGRQYARAGATRPSPAFQDAAPDRWGRMLIERRERIRARQRGEAPRHLTDWDYMAGVSDETRLGALRPFSPDTQQFVDGDRLILPLFHGHPDKRFNVAIRSEQDDRETGARSYAIQRPAGSTLAALW